MEPSKNGEERAFLHELASPLATACLLLESALENIHETHSTSADDLKALDQTVEALERVKSLLQNRQAILRRGG